ncbi:MAG: SdpI family protein [Candidatus Micrarchaeota archaeon]
MQKRIPKILAGLLVVLSFIAGFWALPLLPEKVAIHWNAAGQANGFGSPLTAAFILPVVMLVAFIVFLLIPKIEVYQKNLKKFEAQYWLLGLVIELFLGAVFAVTLLFNLGFEFNMNYFMVPGLALLFFVIGYLSPSFKRNYFVGIRTPWTLASEKVWDQTHKFARTVFWLAAVLVLPILVWPNQFWIWFGLSIACIVAGSFGYSYYAFQKNGRIQD